MAHFAINNTSSNEWFADIGYLDRIIDIRSLFKELDETKKVKVQLRNGKEIQVEGKGIVILKTSNGKVKVLHNV